LTELNNWFISEEAALTLWSDYQNLTDKLLNSVEYPIIQLNMSDQWDKLYNKIISSLKLDSKVLPDNSLEEFMPDYQMTSSNHPGNNLFGRLVII